MRRVVEIPSNLNVPGMRFIRLNSCKESGKASISPLTGLCDWVRNNNLDYKSMQEWLNMNPENNYGVLCGSIVLVKGNLGLKERKLIVIDFDDQLFQLLYAKFLPKTFTVKSAGKGLNHCYYFINDIDFKTKRIQYKVKGKVYSMADIQSSSAYVAGPNSVRDTGRKYEVLHDVPIANINENFLKHLFGTWWSKPKPIYKYKPVKNNSERYDCWDIVRLTKLMFRTTYQNQDFVWGVCPVCGISKGNKKNFCISKKGYYFNCQHCAETGGPTALVSHLLGVTIGKAMEIIYNWRVNEK